ncbi:Sorting nexin-41 [Naganishia friedmannii]|uniref:Sorting nexin-41 n=1 Tax=Naganishia friedmannii TaxID=89922 RepID=A0ACC2VF56_9TREE|nr:Sorting nexin-41 [Naganishia friedmannii]
MNTYEDAPNPFSSDPSPPGTPRDSSSSADHTPLNADKALPTTTTTHKNLDSSSTSSFTEHRGREPHSKPSSVISAASGSPPPTFRASFPSPGVKSYTGPKVKEGNCCERDAELQAGVEISIVDAVKTTEGGKSSYIIYVIKTGNHECRRRYSAFDSLRTSLVALYPVLIVPPIPSKQSLTDYAVKGQSKAKEDATVIARRVRMLEDFLRRVARHPILSGEHVFHRFLDNEVSWSEVLHSPPLSLLPKNPLHAPSHNPTLQSPTDLASSSFSTSPTANDSPDRPAAEASEYASATPYIAHHLLPSPSASRPLKNPDARFMDSEAFTEKFSNHLNGSMEKVNRRVVKRWGERGQGASELGALMNGFSLDNRGTLQGAVEKFGQAVDAEQLTTALLLQQWERGVTEPLHVYAQYARIIRQRLAFRHQKHVQYELVQETLEAQRDKLDALEQAEREARRLEEALESGGRGLATASGTSTSIEQSEEEMRIERERERERQERAMKRKHTAGGSGGGGSAGAGYSFFSAVKHSLSGMMDVDPEATRRANIGRTRDNIAQLEDSLQASAQDLKYASATLQADLDRFQRQKVADLRDMAVKLAEIHRDFAKMNLQAWKEAQSAIRAIEPHPNQPPPGTTSTSTASDFSAGGAGGVSSPSKPMLSSRNTGPNLSPAKNQTTGNPGADGAGKVGLTRTVSDEPGAQRQGYPSGPL